MSVEKYRKKWSNTLIVIVATAIIIGTAFGMGMLHLLTGQGTTGGSEVTASRPTGNGESKVGGTAEQTPAPKEENKSTSRNVIGSNEIIFCSRGLYSSEEKGQAALEEWKGNGGIGALRPSGDKYAIVVGIASDEQSINQLMTKYKNDGVSVLKRTGI